MQETPVESRPGDGTPFGFSRTDLEPEEESALEPYLINVLLKKFEQTARDITQTLLRSARSGVITTGRDFSSGITLGDGSCFIIDEGVPIHSTNLNLTIEYTLEKHDISPGDCFLTNSSFTGNTHHADYTLHVPVFYDGELLFWTLNRAHQADVGAPPPTTYPAEAENIYQEGTHLPSVRIQEEWENVDDLVRMCKLNIRQGDDQWFGDYSAQVAGVRKGEEKIREICEEYGAETVKQFAHEWLRYGDAMMREEIGTLPGETIEYTARHDPIPIRDSAPEGVPVTVELTIRPDDGRIDADLTKNTMKNMPCGFNLSKATTVAGVYGGIFNNLDPEVPVNQGAMNRISIEYNTGTVVGEPVYPTSSAVATTNVFGTLFNAVQAVFGELGEPYGMAEGTSGTPPNCGVISGTDSRRGGETYVNQLFLGGGGGPGMSGMDGWEGMYRTPGSCGVLHPNSVEINERKYPILVEKNQIERDTEGPGKWRGAPASITVFRPRGHTMSMAYYLNANQFPPQGIVGGEAGHPADAYKLDADGERIDVPPITDGIEVTPDERMVGKFAGGGGYGDPFERDPERVRDDVIKGYVSPKRARDVYGVALEKTGGTWEVDRSTTDAIRDENGDERA